MNLGKDFLFFIEITGMNPRASPDPNSVPRGGVPAGRQVIPSDFIGIVRLTNFYSLRSKNLSLTNEGILT